MNTTEMNKTGLVTVSSKYSAAETLARVQTAIGATGNQVFAVFDHAAAASGAGLSLRPTTVVAFGNPGAGTKLMQTNQVVGLELPLKILIWEDESKAVKLTYNDPHWLAKRHELGPETEPVIVAMTGLLASLTHQAAQG